MKKSGLLFLTAGFRFFFLGASVLAIATMAAWLIWLGIHASSAAISEPTIAVAPHFWHGHEMIFGYTAAVIAGFFLTAVPSWTGAPDARMLFVASTGALWLAGRAAIWFSAWIDPWIVALVDLAFLPILSWRLTVNLLKRPKRQNVALLALLALLFAGNAMVHAEWTGLADDTAERGLWVGLFAAAAFISVIGGRVTPAFTRNVLIRAGEPETLPADRPLANRAGVLAAVLLGPLFAFAAPEWLLGLVALVAALANAVRFQGWRAAATIGEPILWALHLGFALLVAGYGLLALAWLTGLIHPIAAMHGLAIGAVGCMTLAMMTRAPLGHTGRPLRVARPIALAYLLVASAMIVRVAGPELFSGFYYTVMFVSGGMWIAAFVIYLAVYWPVLTGPDTRAKPARDT